MLTWDYSWWNAKAPWLIVPLGYMTFFIVAFWIYDMKTYKQKTIPAGTIWSIVVLILIIF